MSVVADDSKSELNPTVVKLGLVSFFADIASEMLYPITPIFLTTILGASMTSLGLIEGVAESIASLLKIYSGSWSDLISRRKPFIVIGYLLGAISKPLIGLSLNWIHVLSARAIDRTGKGLRSAPRDALISESVDTKKLGAALGWHRGMDSLGAAIGPLITILLLFIYKNDLRSIYMWALVPGLISVVIVFLVSEKIHTNKSNIEKKIKIKNPFSQVHLFSKKFKKYVWVWGVFSLTNSSDVFLLMKAKSSGATTTSVILMYCGYNLIYAIMSPVLGKISDKIDRQKILIFGFLIFTSVYLGFGFSNQLWQHSVLFLIYGLYMAATDGIGKAIAIDLLPQNLKATGLGFLATVTGLCALFASFFSGVLWDHFGPRTTFIFGASGAFLALGLTIFFLEHTTPTSE